MFAAKDAGVRVSNIVLMGMGEPLQNLENVIKFLTLVNHEKGLNIGARHISLSTCGLVDKIAELSKYDLQITLSISLHAPNDELRSQIMPINRRYPVAQLLAACDEYTEKTGRRISYEYALIRGFNDTAECARELVRLLRGKLAHVNLIRLNEIEESPLRPSTTEDTEKFLTALNRNGITATLRRRLGFDIDASCGQLRRKYGERK
jgi:23S rRNA (adenine2503-C2)-methyltransferase